MISMVQPLPAGNAIRVFVVPPDGSTNTRVLRRVTDTFTGPDDTGAFLAAEGNIHAFVDTTGLINGQPYFYRDYHLVGGVWVAGASKSGTPAAIYQDQSTEVVEFVRARLHAGLLAEIQRGTLQHELNKIPVLIASPTFEDTKWPVVTIHVANDGPEMRWLGEMEQPDWYDESDEMWVGGEGWLSRVSLNITGWALNADTRAALRKAIKRIVMANLPVFDDHGLSLITLNQQDADDFQSYSAPVYQSIGSFSCLASSAISAVESPILQVISTANVPADFNP
jgi:hypothetical protein